LDGFLWEKLYQYTPARLWKTRQKQLKLALQRFDSATHKLSPYHYKLPFLLEMQFDI